MTDPGTAERTYIEPLTWQIVEKVIERERLMPFSHAGRADRAQ